MPVSYRDRGRYGAHVFLCRLDDDTTLLDTKGEPERFDYLEACQIDKGADPAAIVATRKPLNKPAKTEPEESGEPETFKPRGPGRPAKAG